MASTDHTPFAKRGDEGFESFVERALFAIYERTVNMTDGLAGLAADADAIARALPQIATNLSTYKSELEASEKSLTEKAAALEAAEAKDATAEKELAEAKGELAQVEAIRVKLDPVAGEAASLVGEGGAGSGSAEEAAAGAGSGGAGEAASGGSAEDVEPGEGSAPGSGAAAPGDGSAGTGTGGV